MTLKLTAVLLFLVPKVWTQDCNFDPSKTSPYIVDENYNFPSTLHFGSDDILYIACLKGTASPYVAEGGDQMVCKGDTNILNIRTLETLDFKNIECEGLSSVQSSNEACGYNATLIDVGYKIYQGFASVISVCFNHAKLAQFYVKYKNMDRKEETVTAASSYSVDEVLMCPDGNDNNCSFIDSSGLFFNINMSDIYLNQKEILQNLGVKVSDVLIKFPLAINDPLLPQELENNPFWDYVNVTPMWSDIYSMWLVVRSFFGDTTSNNFFYVGTLGVATLPNTDGDLVELYLSNNNQIPVPKWIWMLYEVGAEVAIIFHSHSILQPEDQSIILDQSLIQK